MKSLVTANEIGGFKKAVFIPENTFLNGKMNYESLNSNYIQLAIIASAWAKNNHVSYSEVDSMQILLNRSIFQVIKDTVKLQASKQLMTFLPCTYHFDDYGGKKDWANTFGHEFRNSLAVYFIDSTPLNNNCFSLI